MYTNELSLTFMNKETYLFLLHNFRQRLNGEAKWLVFFSCTNFHDNGLGTMPGMDVNYLYLVQCDNLWNALGYFVHGSSTVTDQ